MTATAKPKTAWLTRLREQERLRLERVRGYRATVQASKAREKGSGWKPSGAPIPAPVAR